jgi:hypothetical protein
MIGHVQTDRPCTRSHHANLQRKADPVLLSSPGASTRFRTKVLRNGTKPESCHVP